MGAAIGLLGESEGMGIFAKEIEKMRRIGERISEERERIMLALGVDAFVSGRLELTRRFSINRLAQILFECVKCEDNPRADTDWLTAEKFIENNFSPGMKKELVRRDLILRAYNCLRQEQNDISPIGEDIINCFDEGWKKYFDIVRRLLELSDEKRKELFARAAASDENMYDYIGRLIWEWGYQSILLEPYKTTLVVNLRRFLAKIDRIAVICYPVFSSFEQIINSIL